MNRIPRSRKCAVCASPFRPARPLQKVCGPACGAAWARKLAERAKAADAREERKAHRAARERIKTRGEHMREAQAAFNAYVRIRDADKPCISCDRPAAWGGQWHASHYRAVGSNPGWRFNLWNISKSCSICNSWKSGNLTEYRHRLIAKIGLERVEILERESPIRKYSVEYLVRLKRIFREKARRTKKLQDRRMRASGDVHSAAGMPETLLPVYEDRELPTFSEAAEDSEASGF